MRDYVVTICACPPPTTLWVALEHTAMCVLYAHSMVLLNTADACTTPRLSWLWLGASQGFVFLCDTTNHHLLDGCLCVFDVSLIERMYSCSIGVQTLKPAACLAGSSCSL